MYLVNEGLTRRAELTCGASTTSFQEMVLGTETTDEGATNNLAMMTVITTNGGGRVTCSTHAYEADYKAKWIGEWNFTGSLGINSFAIVSSDNKMLGRKKLASTKNVNDAESMRITVRLTEGRGS